MFSSAFGSPPPFGTPLPCLSTLFSPRPSSLLCSPSTLPSSLVANSPCLYALLCSPLHCASAPCSPPSRLASVLYSPPLPPLLPPHRRPAHPASTLCIAPPCTMPLRFALLPLRPCICALLPPRACLSALLYSPPLSAVGLPCLYALHCSPSGPASVLCPPRTCLSALLCSPPRRRSTRPASVLCSAPPRVLSLRYASPPSHLPLCSALLSSPSALPPRRWPALALPLCYALLPLVPCLCAMLSPPRGF